MTICNVRGVFGAGEVDESALLHSSQSDSELALEFAHQLAYMIVMGGRNVNAGDVLDVIAIFSPVVQLADLIAFGGGSGNGLAYNSKGFIEEVDSVGIYIMAMAGMDYGKAADRDMWRRIAESHTGLPDDYYPATPERFLAIERTVAEINGKREKGLPLIPEIKKTW